jgi:uncharacterized membrane protein YoaK (UPF0700 family)
VLLHQIFLAEWIAIKRPNSSHVIPISLEITILLLVGFFEYKAIYQHYQGNGLPFNALFHIQNSMVTQISNSIVRTTHLTGLFTDLGIELSHYFFYKKPNERKS